MRRIAVAAILVGATLCATGLLVVPLAINGFQYHQVDLLSGRNLHLSPQWAGPASGYLLEPQTVTIRSSDPPSFQGQPERVLNLTPLPIPAVILGDYVWGMLDINVTRDAVNVYLVNEENLTMWENGEMPWMLLAYGSFLGHMYVGFGLPREQATLALFLILEASNTKPPDIAVSVSLSASWTPGTGAPDAALVAAPTPTLAEAAQDVRLEGGAASANGTHFDLIILERTSWEQWSSGTPGRILFEGTDNDSYRFMVPLGPLDVQGDPVSFVVRNPGYSDLDIDVNVSSGIVWWEPPFAAARPFLGTLGVVLGFAGIAVAAGGILLEVSPALNRRPDEETKSARP